LMNSDALYCDSRGVCFSRFHMAVHSLTPGHEGNFLGKLRL
jgi:hypothetical protein